MALFGAPTPTNPAPIPVAPSTGFSFTAGAPSFASTPAAPSTGFSFGASSSAPTPGVPGFNSPQPQTTNNANPQQQQQQSTQSYQNNPISNSTVVVPEFDVAFPNLKIQDRMERLLAKVSLDTDEGRWEQQVLHSMLQQGEPGDLACVGSILSHPKVPTWKSANLAIRNQLQTNPVVCFQSSSTNPASMTSAMLQEVFSLADDLRVSEAEALALYAQVSKVETRNWLKEEQLAGTFVVVPMNEIDEERRGYQDDFTVPEAARQLYFCECHALLHTLLLLIQKRIEASQQLDSWGANFLRATDGLLKEGLVHHLLTLVQNYTQQEHNLRNEIVEAKRVELSAPMLTPLPPRKLRLFQTVLREFVQRERQVAAECLFFLTYHTQCNMDEVASLIDLVKDLTNQGLPGIDPFDEKIIPKPQVEAPINPWQAAAPWATPAPSHSATASLPAKDPLIWQKELVNNICQTGQPQLLQSVAVLVLAVMCALDSQHELMNRDLHGPNPFGLGNALLPPGTTDVSGLNLLHMRLVRNSDSEWVHRKDICGLFSASYAMLLRSVPTVLTSPRAGSSSSLATDFKLIWRDCLEAPTDMKSFTFARLTLIPALRCWARQQPVTPCRTDEFYFSVLAEWTSRYLEVLCASGDVPISRAQWGKEREQELAFLRAQQEQNRKFGSWQGVLLTRQGDDEVIPTHVDLLSRPDCMDDVIALAVAVCSTEPDVSSSFWSLEHQDGTQDGNGAPSTSRFVLSRALRNLRILLQEDRSLLPSYLSFLAALASVRSPYSEETGATAVHQILSRIPDTDNGESVLVNWMTIMETLRWYARELGPQDYSLKSSSDSTPATSSTGGSTAYYYGAENPTQTSTSGMSFHDGGTAGPRSSKPKELGETNTHILLSHLAVISNVAAKLPQARTTVLGIKLPVEGSDDGREDSALTILFSLSIVPLSPEVRGAVFATIASLLQLNASPSEEQTKLIRTFGRTGWDLLEDCQVIPMGLLDQYAPPSDGSQRLASNIMFPPSSISLVGDGNTNAVTPNDPAYGIMFEMEHVEACMGWYPSTEGLLTLLCALVKSCGCPFDVGSLRRARSGCLPYIEYVTQFVIPRAFVDKPSSKLPFRMVGDKNRLLARAFDVVEAALAQYTILPTSKSAQEWTKEHQSMVVDANKKLGMAILAEKVVIPPLPGDAALFAYDFRNSNLGEIMVAAFKESDTTQPRSDSFAVGGLHGIRAGTSISAIPFPKSPGFVLLADMLSAQGGKLFHALAGTLVDQTRKRGLGVVAFDEYEANQFACAFALLGALIPNISSAKTIAKGSMPSYPRQALLKSIIPAMEDTLLDSVGVDDPKKWRERVAISALRIFCAVAVREDPFIRAVNLAPVSLNFPPVLQFHRRGSTGALELSTVQLTLLKDILVLNEGNNTLQSLVDMIDYSSVDDAREAAISSSAIALIYYMHNYLLPHESEHALQNLLGRDPLSEKVAKRLALSSERLESKEHAQCVELILEWIVAGLRKRTGSDKTIANRLLGLPTGLHKGTWSGGRKTSSSRPKDCLDAMTRILRDLHFITGKRSSYLAATCFEILVRLCEGGVADVSDLQNIMISAQRLRDVDFWSFHLVALLAEGTNKPSLLSLSASQYLVDGNTAASYVLHSSAWLLKGVANELRLLTGTDVVSGGIDPDYSELRGLFAHRPQQCEKLLSFLFSSPNELLKGVLASIPLSNHVKSVVELDTRSKEDVECATVDLPGPPDVAAGYKRVDYDKLRLSLNPAIDAKKADDLRRWVDNWNFRATWDCASSHLSHAATLVIVSSLESSSRLNGGYSLVVSNNVNGPSSMMRLGHVVDLLNFILLRLTLEESSGSQQYCMDDNLFSMASLYLSQACLLLAERVAFEKRKGDYSLSNFADLDCFNLCEALARAVVSSSVNGAAYSFPRRDERTAILASALGAILRSTSSNEVPFQRLALYMEAGVVLAHMSGHRTKLSPVLDRHGNPHPTAVIAARSSLGIMVDTSSSLEDVPQDHSFTFGILRTPNDSKTRKFSQQLVDLVATLDEHISALIISFARSPFGGDVLLDSGLGKAFISAGDRYASEEARALKQYGLSMGAYTAELVTPDFFREHMQIIKSVLLSPNVSHGKRKALAGDIPTIMNGHRIIIGRLFASFPLDNDVLMTCFECVALAEGILQSDPSEQVRSIPLPEAGLVDLSIFELTFHLLDNPFPRKVLSQLPQALRGSESGEQFHMAPLLRQERVSWWDKIAFSTLAGGEEGQVLASPLSCGLNMQDTQGYSSCWTEVKYEFSVRGMELAVLGLTILIRKARHDNFPFTTDLAVARSLCRIADAARAIEGHVYVLDQSLGPSKANTAHDEMMTEGSTNSARILEKKYLRRLGIKMGRCAELLLVVALARVRTIKSFVRNRDSDEQTSKWKEKLQFFSKALTVALEYNSIESMGVGCVIWEDGDVRREFAIKLAKMLRNELV